MVIEFFLEQRAYFFEYFDLINQKLFLKVTGSVEDVSHLNLNLSILLSYQMHASQRAHKYVLSVFFIEPTNWVAVEKIDFSIHFLIIFKSQRKLLFCIGKHLLNLRRICGIKGVHELIDIGLLNDNKLGVYFQVFL